jgi:hypothetical protein
MWKKYSKREMLIWQNEKVVGARRQCMGDEEKHMPGTVHSSVANMREIY